MGRARGLDFSHYQLAHLMKLAMWRLLGFIFGFVRLSIGSSQDSQAHLHLANLRANGWLFGPYHALHENGSPRQQARFFLALIEELCPDHALPAMLDVERPNLSEWHVTEFLHEWGRLTKRQIAIYTSANSWHKIVGRGMRLWARALPLWIAGYPYDRSDYKADGTWQGQLMDAASVARRSAEPPAGVMTLIPDPWSLPIGTQPAKGPEWFQHTGHGRLEGYAKDLDLNVFMGTEAELVARYAPVPEQETTMRLCAHIIGGSTDAVEFTREAKAPVVMLVDDWGAAAAYAAMAHRPLVVGRKVVEPELRPDYLADHGFDPSVIAELYFEANLKPHVLANPAVQAWCGPCEPVCKTAVAMEWYSAFEAARVVLLATLGKRAVVANFSTGQPEPHLWPFFHEALGAIRRHGGYLGLHEYSEPSRSWDTWYVGRFTRAPRDVKKIMTEHGTDSLPPVPEDGSLPVRHPAGQPWRGQFEGTPQKPIEAYADWLIRMDQQYRQHPDIVGVCIFTFGQLWPDHNVEGTGLAQRLIDYARGNPEVPPTPPPPPPAQEEDPMDEMLRLTLIKLANEAKDNATATIRLAEGAIFRADTIIKALEPKKWWEEWPSGPFPLPGRALATLNRVMTFYRETGVAFNPPATTRVVNWTMFVVERKGNLLKVWDNPVGQADDWWVRAEDVVPQSSG